MPRVDCYSAVVECTATAVQQQNILLQQCSSRIYCYSSVAVECTATVQQSVLLQCSSRVHCYGSVAVECTATVQQSVLLQCSSTAVQQQNVLLHKPSKWFNHHNQGLCKVSGKSTVYQFGEQNEYELIFCLTKTMLTKSITNFCHPKPRPPSPHDFFRLTHSSKPKPENLLI